MPRWGRDLMSAAKSQKRQKLATGAGIVEQRVSLLGRVSNDRNLTARRRFRGQRKRVSRWGFWKQRDSGRLRSHEYLRSYSSARFWNHFACLSLERTGDRPRIHLTLLVGVSLVLTNQSVAQTAVTTEDKCQAQTQTEEDDATATKRSLTETLDECNGILIPPPTGDEEVTEPAPNVGETPVIRPDEIPEQPDSK